MHADDKIALVTGLNASHGERLRRFLARRLKGRAADVADLAQEVFLRLWRVSRPETIRNPEAYLFTIANHVLHQYALGTHAGRESAEALDALVAQDSDPAHLAARTQRLEALGSALATLPVKTQAALVLYRRDGFTLGEVARQLAISEAMVKKHLVKAILHCRARLPPESESP